MRQSSIYVSTVCHFMPRKTSSIKREKTPEAVTRPIGILTYSYKPSGVENAVNGDDDSVSGTCQNAVTMSSDVKYLEPLSADKESSTLGSGYASRWTILLRAL